MHVAGDLADDSAVQIEFQPACLYHRESTQEGFLVLHGRCRVLIEGEERALMLRGATFDAVPDWRKLYKQAECIGLEPVDGRASFDFKCEFMQSEAVEIFVDNGNATESLNLIAQCLLVSIKK